MCNKKQIDDASNLLIFGRHRPLFVEEPSKSDRTLWLRWCMATHKVSLCKAYHLLHDWLEEEKQRDV